MLLFQKLFTVPELELGSQEDHICGLLVAGCVSAGFGGAGHESLCPLGCQRIAQEAPGRNAAGAVLVDVEQPELLCKCC